MKFHVTTIEVTRRQYTIEAPNKSAIWDMFTDPDYEEVLECDSLQEGQEEIESIDRTE